NITDIGISSLQTCTNLRQIDLDYVDLISDEGQSSKKRKQQAFVITQNRLVTGVKALAKKCVMLEEVYLSNCTNITVESLRCLAENCGGLSDVTVDGTSITTTDVDQISVLRPDIDIEGTKTLSSTSY